VKHKTDTFLPWELYRLCRSSHSLHHLRAKPFSHEGCLLSRNL
jgi:hypothetical protein